MLLETLQQFPASWFHGTKSLDIDLTGGHQAAPLFLPFDHALAHLMLTRHGQLRRALLKALFQLSPYREDVPVTSASRTPRMGDGTTAPATKTITGTTLVPTTLSDSTTSLASPNLLQYELKGGRSPEGG